MSAANDKISKGIRAQGSNALVASRVLPSGFTNVLFSDSFYFASGEKCNRLVFFGEEAPGTTYDAVAQIGDEYWRIAFTSNAPSSFAMYEYTANGWEKRLTQDDADAVWNRTVTVTALSTAGAGTYSAAQIEGGVIARDPAGADRTDTTSTAALIAAAIDSVGVGSSIRCFVKNTADADETITLAGGVGVTLSPTVIKIKPGQSKELMFVVTNAGSGTEAVTCYDFTAIEEQLSKFRVTDATAGAKTWTIAELLAGVLLRDPAGANRSDVSPTAALIVAGIPDARVGQTFEFTLVNTADADEVITFTGGVGVTLAPTSITIGRAQSKKFLAVLTNVTGAAEAVTIYDVDSLGYANVNARVFTKKTVLTTATPTAATLSAAQLIGGHIRHDAGGGPIDDTLDTAANIVAAIPGCQVGSSFECVVENISDGAEVITIVTSAGNTLATNGLFTIARTYAKRLLFVVTNVGTPAVSVYVTGNWIANSY